MLYTNKSVRFIFLTIMALSLTLSLGRAQLVAQHEAVLPDRGRATLREELGRARTDAERGLADRGLRGELRAFL